MWGCAVLATPAGAVDVSGDQFGTWALAQSPYQLTGDVRVPPGEMLIIEPGVVVTARGHYKLTVDQATLLAVGTAQQQILMTAQTQVVGWRGIRFEQADDSSVISYCIIEYAKGSGDWPGVRGGAIHCKGCSPTISCNELRFNQSCNENYNGTGAGVTTDDSSALIVGNYIHHNIRDSGGGICCLNDNDSVISGNLITNNTAHYCGGGIYFGSGTAPIAENNVVMHNDDNMWGGGGISSWGSHAIIRNNVIAKNTTTKHGGGLYCRYDTAVIQNNTIVDNQASQYGGGIYVLNQAYTWPEVSNTIIWGNSASAGDQIYLCPDTESAVNIECSDVEGGWAGTGNINTDPLFVDAGQEDYHLSAASPCIDAGDSGFVPEQGESDMDGEPRVVDGDGDEEQPGLQRKCRARRM